MKTVLVTGGAGYIGSALVKLLRDQNFRVKVLDSFLYGEMPQALVEGAEYIRGDCCNYYDVLRALEDVEQVVHLAGIVGAPACDRNFDQHLAYNIGSVKTLVNCMMEIDKNFVRDLIFASSCSVYGNVAGIFDSVDESCALFPLSSYAHGKVRAEKAIKEIADKFEHFRPTILRFTTVFGMAPRPRLDLVVNQFCYKSFIGEPITITGSGDQYRSLVHVNDLASAILTTLKAPGYLREGQVFHVGDENNNKTIKQIAEIIQDRNPSTIVEYANEMESDRRDYRINCMKIKSLLGWTVNYSVELGVEQILRDLEARAGEIDWSSPRWRNVG